MTTNIIVLGNYPPQKVKPIQFLRTLKGDSFESNCFSKPTDFDNVELICKDYYKGHHDSDKEYGDLMFAYYDDRKKGILYLGLWNDGVI